MKYLNENKLMKIVNFKDLDGSWSVKDALNRDKDKKKKKTGKKKLDFELGDKVIDLLAKYNLYSSVVGSGDYCTKWKILLPGEENFKEYRVMLGEKKNFEDWVEYNYGSENDLSDEELKDEYSKDYGDDTRLEWSVFLPLGTSSLEQSALVDSSNYLKLLSESYPDMFKNQLEYTNALSDNPDGFKKFINNKGIKITNKNVEIVNSICTRLYKDSKVFGCFRECIGKQKTKQLIQDWLKLIK